jgi:competence protein ComEC
LLGDPDGLAPESRLALRRSGLAHLIAVSGFNVTLVAILVAAVGSGLARAARLTAVALALSLYVACVGGSASVLRAFGMALLGIAALALGRAPRALHALAASAFLLIATDPAMVHEPGFQLSFAATAGLLLLTGRWSERLGRSLPRPLAIALAASLAAQAASLPLSAAIFGEIPPAAPVLNLFAVPWAAACLVLALAWVLVALPAPEIADLLLPLLDWAALPLAALAALPPTPLLSVPWTGGLIGALVPAGLIGALGEGGAVLRHTLLGLLLLAQAGGESSRPRAREVLFVDVGQGDATLLRLGRRAVLVDGGGAPDADIGGRVLRPLLAARGLSRIEVAVLTHADLDHCQGLVDLAAYVPITEIWAARGSASSPCLAELARRTRRVPRWLARGDRRSAGGFDFEVLHPPRSAAGGSDNSSSLVLAVDGGGRRLLLAADIDARTERDLIATGPEKLTADLLKVAHHGSSGSSHAEILAAVRPRIAVLSAGGRNPYGHPSEATIARLRAAGTRVLRTDRDGLVVVRWTPAGPWRLELPGSPRRIAPGQ